MTFTLTADTNQLDGTVWSPGDMLVTPVANVGGKLVSVTITGPSGVIMNAREHGFDPTTPGVFSVTLPSADVDLSPADFGFKVRLGAGGAYVVVPAQTAGSTHALADFIENVATLPLTPSEVARLNIVENALADEVGDRAAGDATNATAIATEATNRANADTALATSIADEATTRGNADTALSTAIAAEVTRATTAEGTKAPQATTYTKTEVDTADGLRLAKAQNLGDLPDPDSARSNLSFPSVVARAFTRTGIADADTAAGTSKYVELPAGTYTIASNLTVTRPVVLQRGAVIRPMSGVTVNLNGGIAHAPRSQVFDHSLGGKVVPRGVDYYHPSWWGAIGTADDSTAWNDMSASLTLSEASNAATSSTMGQRVLAPSGINRMLGVVIDHGEIVADQGIALFVPPVAATSGTVLRLGDFARLRGGQFACSGSQAVKLIHHAGVRAVIDGAYVAPGATGSLGVYVASDDFSTITPMISNLSIRGGSATTAGMGMQVYSADGKFKNIWVGLCSTGIDWQRTSAQVTNLHVWGNGAGMTGSPDNTDWTNCHIETNLGWGVDFVNTDRGNYTNFHVWANGAGVASTGGFRLDKTAGNTARDNAFNNCVFDDNTGVGLYLGQVDGVTGSGIRFVSRTAAAGGTTLADKGLYVASTATGVELDIKGRAADHLTAVVDNQSTGASVVLGRIRRTLTTDITWTSSTSLTAALAAQLGANERWVFSGFMLVDSSTVADFKYRLAAPSATGVSGYFGAIAPNSGVTNGRFDNGTALTTSGSTWSFGTNGVGSVQTIPFHGFVATAGTPGTLELQAGPNASDATVTTLRAGTTIELVRVA